MDRITAGFFLMFGIGLVLVALQGAARGWLPTGPNGLRQGVGVHRDRQPVAFWCFFLLYGGGGLALAVHAVRLLAGAARSGAL